MEITTMMIGSAALGTVAAIAIVLVWPRRRRPGVMRLVGRSRSKSRSGSRSRDWFRRDPVMFTGAEAGMADCGAGSDGGPGGGGGGCD